MFYYAKLNEDQICTQIITRARELPRDLDEFIKIPDYNETLLWRKYDSKTGWSQERYEPDVDTVVQNTLKELKEENLSLSAEVNNLNNTVSTLNGSIMELTMIIAALQGGM